MILISTDNLTFYTDEMGNISPLNLKVNFKILSALQLFYVEEMFNIVI